MTPDQFKFAVDIVVILVGVWAMLSLRKAAIGGKFGAAMTFILAGIFVLTLNHFLDTVYLGKVLLAMGHKTDYLQPAIVHRVVNLAGFLLMAVGFSTFSR